MPQTNTKPADVEPVVDAIRPMLAGREPDLVGAVLADLVAIYIASHAPELRDDALELHTLAVEALVPVEVALMIEAGRAPARWRG